MSERWSRENLELVGGVPWKLEKDKVGDGEEMSRGVIVMDKDYKEKLKAEVVPEAVPRQMYIQKQDLEEHGYTERCPGCVSILRGTTRQAHLVGCRRRVEKAMEETKKARRAGERMEKFAEKVEERGGGEGGGRRQAA